MENTLSKQISLVERSIAQLDNWITQNGWAGYDPYDFKQHPLFTTSKSTFTKKTLGRAILLTESFFPMLTRDVAPTILYLADIGIPQDMDGRVLFEIFEDEFVNKHSASEMKSMGMKKGIKTEISADDENKIRKKLEDLGYL